MKKLFLSLLILVTFVLVPININAINSIYIYQPTPNGLVGISNPNIEWKVVLQSNKVENVVFYLNNKPLKVKYDEKREVFYAETNNLSGYNKVYAKIKLKGWPNEIIKNWSFTVTDNSISSLPKPSDKQNQAINFANDYRYTLQNPIYTFNSSLNMAASKHAEYQTYNSFGHYQLEGTRGFFGRTINERTEFFGFYGNVAEDISYQSNTSIQDAVDSLFDAPYHRIPFLIPSYSLFGYGSNGYYHVINFGDYSEEETKWVAYPGSDDSNIPIYWDNYETPDPLRFYTNVNKRVGYPIVVGVYGTNVSEITYKYANLWDEDGKQIATYVNSPKNTGGNDEELNNEIIIIPKEPLKLGEKYKVRVILEANEKNINKIYDKTWYFTTETKAENGKNIIHNQFQYPSFNKETEEINFYLGQRYMTVDNIGYPLDAEIFIENSRAMVPFRALGNSFGAFVDWNPQNKTVVYIKDDKIIELPINSNVVKINGEEFQLDQGAIIKNGRSYVPTRFISEQLGAQVYWIPEYQEVLIKPKH